MKGKMVLENKIRKAFKIFGVTVTMHDQFLYSKGFVFFTPFESPILGKYHREWIKEKFNYEISENKYFLFSLLHEVGHHYTLQNLTDEQINNEILLRAVLDFSEKSPKEINEAYFNLYAEKLATAWAISFMKTHPNWIKKHNRLINDALNHFNHVNKWA